MYAPYTQRNGIALPFLNVPGGHVDDVSSLSALYQSVLWDCGAWLTGDSDGLEVLESS